MWIFRGEKRERKENPREISIYSRWFRVVSIPKLGGTSNLTPCLPHSHRETGGTTRTERRRATPPETFWNCSHLFDHLGFLSPSSPCSEIRATRGTRNCGTHSDSPRRGVEQGGTSRTTIGLISVRPCRLLVIAAVRAPLCGGEWGKSREGGGRQWHRRQRVYIICHIEARASSWQECVGTARRTAPLLGNHLVALTAAVGDAATRRAVLILRTFWCSSCGCRGSSGNLCDMNGRLDRVQQQRATRTTRAVTR